MDLWQRKQTLSLGCTLGLDSFTVINPLPRAITITNYPIRTLASNPSPNPNLMLIHGYDINFIKYSLYHEVEVSMGFTHWKSRRD